MNEKIHNILDKNHLTIVVLLIIILLLLIYTSFFKKDSAIRLETLKVGWQANMAKVEKLYKSDNYKQQQTAAIDQVLWTTSAQQADTTTATDTTNIATNSIDKSKVDNIKSDWYIEWNKNARITILEYSDLLCPFCKRQKDNKVIEQLLEKYPNDVNAMFEHFIVHPDAKRLAQAAECVGQAKWWAKFFEFIAKWFDLTDTSDAGLTTLATSLWMWANNFKDCLTSDKFSSKIDNSTELWRTLFGISWTPWNVVIDNEKWTYTVIAWAYPVEKFQEVIDSILATK